ARGSGARTVDPVLRLRRGRGAPVARRQFGARRSRDGQSLRPLEFLHRHRDRHRALAASRLYFGALPKTSTIVAVTVPVFLHVCLAPPLSDSTCPCVTSTGGSPSTVSVS